jgi:hypothetical protein
MRNYAEEYDEPRRKRYIQCSDRMCGADDCPNCRPGNFRGGVYIGDIEEAEAAEAEETESPNAPHEPRRE